MSGFRSSHWRVALLPVLLLAALLLPTLHLHPVHEHGHHGDSHQYAIIHADFLSVAAHDHRHAQHEDIALGDIAPAGFSQSGLSALLVRSVDSLLPGLEKGPEFLLVDLAVAHTQLNLFTYLRKRDQPPPLRQVFLAPNSPRSPPSFA